MGTGITIFGVIIIYRCVDEALVDISLMEGIISLERSEPVTFTSRVIVDVVDFISTNTV